MPTPRERVLVVDDEPGMCRLLTAVLGDAGFRVSAYTDPGAALTAFERAPYDLVISDLSMPKVGGVDVLRAVRERAPAVPVILITAYGTTKNAVEALKLGTSDFIPKPFRNEEIRLAVESVLERRRLVEENASLRRELASRAGFGGFAGVSRAARSAFEALSAAAEHDRPVLILGEAGVGKTHAARELHRASARARGPFVSISAEDAGRDFRSSDGGRLAKAEGGTLFVRDAPALTPDAQSSLARMLAGARPASGWGGGARPLNARLVVSSREPLAELARAGRFRQDLLRRLSGTVVEIPPLRERPEDAPALLEEFLIRAAKRRGVPPPTPGIEVVRHVTERPWPGNAAELEAAVERAMLLSAGGPLRLEHFDSDRVSEADILPFREEKRAHVDSFERRYLKKLVSAFSGNVTRMALAAGMDRKNLYELLKKHGFAPRPE